MEDAGILYVVGQSSFLPCHFPKCLLYRHSQLSKLQRNTGPLIVHHTHLVV